MKIIAIDPGTNDSALVVWSGTVIEIAATKPNEELLFDLRGFNTSEKDTLIIEEIKSYGMSVGQETLDTCVWVGRFYQAWMHATGKCSRLVPRLDIRLHHCKSPKATDSNVRRAIIDKYGSPGTKKHPGPTGCLRGGGGHMWQAFAVAAYAIETSK